MPDKNLTDIEIVKILNEADGMEHIAIFCADGKSENMQSIPMMDIINLINRLQADNEQMQKDGETLAISLLNAKAEIKELKSAINGFRGYEEKIKAEAYKEFAEEVNKSASQGWTKSIDDILKEMVGEDNAST